MNFAPARGNGSRRGGWRPTSRMPSAAKKDSEMTTPAPPVGGLFDEVALTSLEESASKHRDSAVIRDSVIVVSYNWMRNTKASKCNPTIMIPGSPPRWSPPSDQTQLREDQGAFYRDRNAAQYPLHPMEPAIIAGIHADPNLAKDVNIVACSSTLGNLLRFVRGQEKSFRILVELIDEALFFVRRENSPTELIPGVRGYGHTFPDAYTAWDSAVKQSTSHQRLLRYNFGGLHLLVRFEADGFLPAPDEASKPLLSRAKGTETFDVENLTKQFEKAQAQLGEDTAITSTNDELAIKETGEGVGQDRIFDLKTRALWKKDQDLLSGEIPRLWVAQISNFVAAYHERGTFKPENIVIQDVRQDVAKWEKDQSVILAQLVKLLHTLISKAHEQKDGKFEICRSGEGNLELRRQMVDVGETLSPSAKTQWIRSSQIESSREEVRKGDSENTTNALSWDDGSSNDYTACTDACHYCGRCTY
ncbi:hypothetical protein LSUE1_G003909 [Lachnellula suecica]|uniref:Uncharacterized protein n=1 Tax=Lachnellula suecica TaxID=602035 RepID=A0A8T9C658_9HELO|nr:hypothetical protein LSUE1_G003909 [Lachnellula suecica]